MKKNRDEKIVIPPDYSIKPLVIAIVTRAAMEAGAGKMEAKVWIRDEAIIWLDAVKADIHPDLIAKFVNGGCKVRNAQTRYQNMSAYANNNRTERNRRIEEQTFTS